MYVFAKQPSLPNNWRSAVGWGQGVLVIPVKAIRWEWG